MARYRVTVAGKNYDAMADLVRKHKLNIAGHTGRKAARGRYVVDAFADTGEIETLQSAGYRVDVHEDVEEAGTMRQAEVRSFGADAEALSVAAGNRYLNVDDVERSLATVAAGPNVAFTRLLELPNKTWEGRTCHALKIANGNQAGRPGIFLLGGIHAREWGSSDILINFVEQLCDAFRTQTGLAFGGMNFTAAQIQQIVNQKDVYVFPQANPDGRHHSMTADPSWRKNRRPAPAGSSHPNCVGVDLNRNYDFLWKFPMHFAPNAPVQNSTDPCNHDIYIGPSPLSEPETKNVVSMFDDFPNIRFFVDVHSYSEDILYNWGDDDNQTNDPQMNFKNPAFDGKRGVGSDSGYREFIRSAEKDRGRQARQADARRHQGRARPRLHGHAVDEPLPDGRNVGRLRLQPPSRRCLQAEGLFVHHRMGQRDQHHAVSSAVSGDETDHPGDHRGAAAILPARLMRTISPECEQLGLIRLDDLGEWQMVRRVQDGAMLEDLARDGEQPPVPRTETRSFLLLPTARQRSPRHRDGDGASIGMERLHCLAERRLGRGQQRVHLRRQPPRHVPVVSLRQHVRSAA